MTEPANNWSARIAELQPGMAAAMLEQHGADEGALWLQDLPAGIAATVLSSMLPRDALECLKRMDVAATAQVLEAMGAVRAVPLLRLFEDSLRNRILDHCSEHIEALRFLLRYPDSVVGAWMQTDVFLLPRDVSVGEALQRIRSATVEPPRDIFVVNRQQQISGAVLASALLRQDPERALTGVIRPVPYRLRTRTALWAVRDHPGWRDWEALPVVNRENRLVGVLQATELRRRLKLQTGGDGARGSVSSDGLLELAEWSWQGLADLLDAALKQDAKPGERKHG